MKLARFGSAVLLLLALSLDAGVVAQPADTSSSTKLKQAIAKELVSAADAASDNGQNATAAEFLNEALALVPDDRKAAKALEKLDNEQNSEDAEAVAKYEKKVDKALKKAANGYCQLFSELITDKDRTTVNAWLARAFELHAETANDWVESEYRALYGKKDFGEVYRLLNLAQLHPTGDEKKDAARESVLTECVADLSVRNPLLMQCREHDMNYYISLPAGWTKDKEWPIYVTQEGAGSNFQGMNRGAAKGNKEFIVITCCTFSNTNSLDGQAKKYPYTQEFLDKWAGNRLAFDEPGLLAVMKEVRELYNGTEKICITGYSGGGILTWHMVFKHPDKVIAAVPACANFAGAQEISDDTEAKKKIIVHAYQGEKDQHKETMLDAQWESALKLAKANGYENVTRDIIPGGHIACHAQAREVFLKACGIEE
ncbi:MAG: hypothetical protein KDB29_15945 [Planctomycetes bacterium]|nr:hypothetical protein [Planctomycetota bacterium]